MSILSALALGASAGFIDIAPMIRAGVYRFSILSVFIQWLLIGLAITFIAWDTEPWLKGMTIGILGMLPTAVMALGRNRSATLPTLLYGAVLGAGIGWSGSLLG